MQEAGHSQVCAGRPAGFETSRNRLETCSDSPSCKSKVFLRDDAHADTGVIHNRHSPDLVFFHSQETDLHFILKMTGDRMLVKDRHEAQHFGVFAGGHHIQTEITIGHHAQQAMGLGLDHRDDADIFF